VQQFMKRSFQILFLLLLLKTGYCQTGNVTGYIFDDRRAKALSFAMIEIKSLKLRTIANDSGYFKFDSLPVGQYEVSVLAASIKSNTMVVDIFRDSTVFVIKHVNEPCKYDTHVNNNTCPLCQKNDTVIPILYGLPLKQPGNKEVYYAGCETVNCDPNWYCKRDNHKF
jgi:hypothetical protein